MVALVVIVGVFILEENASPFEVNVASPPPHFYFLRAVLHKSGVGLAQPWLLWGI